MDSRIPLTLLSLLGLSVTIVTAAHMPIETSKPDAPLLMRRNDCPANMFQCPTSLGPAFSDVCCYDGQTCAVDNNDKPACCPSGVVCTGAAPTGNPSKPTQATSYVENSYFSFPYAMTNFDNSASCASAASACSENYEICTKQLGGEGDYAVTIEVPGGGGVTVDGSNQNLGTSATSICSSLSSEACSAVEATQCDSFDDAASSLHPRRGIMLAGVALSSIAVRLLG